LERRELLAAFAALGASFACGCAAKPSPPSLVPNPPAAPLAIKPLHHLVAAGGLSWAIITKPKSIFEMPQLHEGLSSILPEQRLRLFQSVTAIDLTKVETAIIASYPKSTLYVVDGVPAPLEAERRYRERLTKGIVRSSFRDDLVMVRGLSAQGELRSLAALGPDVVAIEVGADAHLKAAILYAQGKLHRSQTFMQVPELAALAQRFGSAPLLAFAPGPFVGQWKNGLRGLLSTSSAAGAALRLTPVGSLQGVCALLGDWGSSAEMASQHLRSCWNDIANSGFGRLTGLAQPVVDPLLTHGSDVISLTAEVDSDRFLKGLKAVLGGQSQEMMGL
jgi:hypothetical protein